MVDKNLGVLVTVLALLSYSAVVLSVMWIKGIRSVPRIASWLFPGFILLIATSWRVVFERSYIDVFVSTLGFTLFIVVYVAMALRFGKSLRRYPSFFAVGKNLLDRKVQQTGSQRQGCKERSEKRSRPKQ